MATLTNIDWKNRRAKYGMKLTQKENRKKGIGTDTVMAIIRYVFDELQPNRLDGSWFKNNYGSKKMYTKCAWKVEGKCRHYIYKNGIYRDLVIVGILKDDYRELLISNNYWD